MSKRKQLAFLLAVAVVMTGGFGCLGYRLGTTLPPGVQSLHVPTFVNRTDEPDIEVETTNATLREFQKDGALSIATAEQADAVLSVTLERFRLDPLRYERDSDRAAAEYRLTLTARISLTRRGETEPMLTRRIEGDTTFEPSGEITLSKRDALPAAAEDLAYRITRAVIEFW